MAAGRRRKPTGRKLRGKSLLKDSEAYRELIERPDDLQEEISELDTAKTTEEQLRVCRQLNEQIIREGRA